jgi:hypothetical protein
VTNVFSEDGKHLVRIKPGNSIGDAVGFSGGRQGTYARAEFYAQQPDRSLKLVAEVSLKNPVAPVDSVVSNAGYLITFDNWHNLGFGHAVAIYSGSGKLIATYELEQLYSKEQLAKIPVSVSSRWWRCSPYGFVDPDKQTKVYVFEYFGGTFVFDLATGAFKYNSGSAECRRPSGPVSATWLGGGRP